MKDLRWPTVMSGSLATAASRAFRIASDAGSFHSAARNRSGSSQAISDGNATDSTWAARFTPSP